MRSRHFIVYSVIVFFVFSCSSSPQSKRFGADPEVVVKDAKTWWDYHYHNINLSTSYIPLDTSSKIITKEDFLQRLSSGNYVAFKVETKDTSLKYKLYPLGSKADPGIKGIVKELGGLNYQRYKMEGTEIPDFNFTDLKGKIYNKETTKGKIVVLKCWFIHCQVCVEEMSALNEVVQQFGKRSDVVFISMAFDSRTELQNFLLKKRFDYAVIPVQMAYLENKLGVTEYPTQFIIDRNGKIVKVVSDYRDRVSVLKREILQ